MFCGILAGMTLFTVCTEMTGKELKGLRYKAGLTNVEEAARVCGVTAPTWYRWESGSRIISNAGLLYRALMGLRAERELAAREKEAQKQ